jgi:thiol-disulfide isomerase/thioredoxin
VTTPTATEQAPQRSSRNRRILITAAILAGVVAGLAGVYGIANIARNPDAAACRDALETAKRITPFARGEVAALTPGAAPLRLPTLAFQDGAGRARSLADWRGRTVLLNLWATWCVPCRKEMPALDALEGNLGGPSFEVVAVNIDQGDPEKPKAWLNGVGIKRLGYYADPSGKVFTELKLVGLAFGMPTTILVDPAGCEIAAMAGPAEWASDAGVKLIKAAIGQAS